MKRKVFGLLLAMIAAVTWMTAQSVHHVKIGINGLHCSACTFSVEKSLRKLDFVRLVTMDLNARNGEVYLQEGENIDFQALAKAVEAAGFSVRSFIVHFDQELNSNSDCIDEQFCIVEKRAVTGNRLRLVGKGFLERKALKEMGNTLNSDCSCKKEDAIMSILL